MNRSPRIAYIMSRFPKITETFILYEILALEARGVTVDVHPLLREREAIVHPEAQRMMERIRFHPFLSPAIVAANLRWLFKRPLAYLGALGEVLRGTWGSLNFFVGAVGIFPKAALFAQEMQRAGVDHVHAHFATHPAVAALVVRRLAGIPFSFTVHGHDLHVEKRMLAEKIRAACFVVSVSEYNRRTIVEACGPWADEKIRIVHCGIDPTVFRMPERAANPPELRILCVGRFDEVKGHPILVDACRRLADRGARFRCDLVGEGPLREDVEAAIRAAGLEDRIHTLGARPRLEVVRLLGAADVFALPSVMAANGEREGIPVALMEAMATGVPVVTSRLSGIPELVEHEVTGLLVEPRDAAGLAAALERLAGDRALRERLGRAGREKVLAEFDLSRNVDALAGLLLRSGAAAADAGVASARGG